MLDTLMTHIHTSSTNTKLDTLWHWLVQSSRSCWQSSATLPVETLH